MNLPKPRGRTTHHVTHMTHELLRFVTVDQIFHLPRKILHFLRIHKVLHFLGCIRNILRCHNVLFWRKNGNKGEERKKKCRHQTEYPKWYTLDANAWHCTPKKTRVEHCILRSCRHAKEQQNYVTAIIRIRISFCASAEAASKRTTNKSQPVAMQTCPKSVNMN